MNSDYVQGLRTHEWFLCFFIVFISSEKSDPQVRLLKTPYIPPMHKSTKGTTVTIKLSKIVTHHESKDKIWGHS